MFGAQCTHQRVLDKVVGKLGIAGERARVAAQGRNGCFDVMAKAAHAKIPVPRFLRQGSCHPAGDGTGEAGCTPTTPPAYSLFRRHAPRCPAGMASGARKPELWPAS